MMVLVAVRCPHCQSSEVVKHGKSTNGKQHFRCLEPEYPYQTFSLNLAYPGRNLEVKQQIVEMTTPVACGGKPVFSAGSSMGVEYEILPGFCASAPQQ